MQTRSRTKLTNQSINQLTKQPTLLEKSYAKAELEVNIDFDDAIIEWNKNKKQIGNGHYKYICTVITNKNKTRVCNNVCYKEKDKCWIHRNK